MLRRHLLLAPLVLAACGKAPPKGQRVPLDGKIICAGDSLTFGYGASPGASYPSILKQLSGREVVNEGVNGDTTTGLLNRLPGILSQQPALILAGIGGNDFLRKVPIAQSRQALLGIVAKCKQANTQLVLIAEPQPSLSAAVFRALEDHPVYQSVADETQTLLFSDGWSAILGQSELRSDAIHANDKGYALFAQRLYSWLKDREIL